jgi:glycosyltransferase involved in cell wall biosynthesis
MAERIISLLKEPIKARAMGRLGRQVVEDRFSSAAQLKRTEQLYDKLLSRQWRIGENRAVKLEC